MDIRNLAQVTLQFIQVHATTMALAIAAVALLLLFRKKIRHGWRNLKTRRCLKRLGHKQILNLQWPDGLGHYFTINRLIMRPDGISLLVYHQYPGKIFCADSIDDWTQMVGQKSYRFKNPLYELDYQIKAIAADLPEVPVNGFLFFHHLAEFPKGHPERVIHLEKIPDELKRNRKAEVTVAVHTAWKKLATLSRK